MSVHGASAFVGAFTQINMINNDFVFVKGSPKEVVAKLTDKSSSKQEREASGTALGDDC